MAQEGKFKSIDGKKTLTVKIRGGSEPAEATDSGAEVEAYQAGSETFSVTGDDGRILTITIAE
ncbi:MAG: hypothetical protein LC734_08665 [Acidobacteria bacterium]|nr:hypothetical protein [Acidobacteriota bacterium]